jgi:hypothetical protein
MNGQQKTEFVSNPGGCLVSGSSPADRYREIGIAPQFQDQMGGRAMHGSIGGFRGSIVEPDRKFDFDE